MKALSFRQKASLAPIAIVALGALFLCLVGSSAVADTCKNRGTLDEIFCDEDGDLLADSPKDPAKWIDPDPLIFSYTAVEDPSVYENVFSELMDYIAQKTGKRVKWYGPESYAAQVEAISPPARLPNKPGEA